MIVHTKNRTTHITCRRCSGRYNMKKRQCYCGYPYSKKRNR